MLAIMCGLRALIEVLRAYDTRANDDRKPVVMLMNRFLDPVCNILQTAAQEQSEMQFEMMILCCKIFHISNRCTLLPCMHDMSKITEWINYFVSILET